MIVLALLVPPVLLLFLLAMEAFEAVVLGGAPSTVTGPTAAGRPAGVEEGAAGVRGPAASPSSPVPTPRPSSDPVVAPVP